MPIADTRLMTAHVPMLMAEQVNELANHFERARGWIVKQALAAYIEREELRRRMKIEALGDVDVGRDVTHAQVKTWAASLGTDTSQPFAVPIS